MYSTIVVPLDGSPFSELALPAAVALARRSDAVLELVHVREPPARGWNAPVPDTGLDDEMERQIQGRVSSLADALTLEPGLRATAVFLGGEVAPVVQAYVAEHGADLVVMTTHGRGGWSRAWLGSVADELVRRATTPLLLVRPGAEGASGSREPLFCRILVPLDGSSRAEEVLPHATALGTPRDTAYLLLRVVTLRAAVDPFPSLGAMLDGADIARRVEEDRVHAAAYLKEVADSLAEVGARATVHTVVHGQVAPAILEFAREHAVDLLVLSTRVRSATERRLVGSVADKVLRGATVPVLICGPHLGAGTASVDEAAATASPDTGRAALAR